MVRNDENTTSTIGEQLRRAGIPRRDFLKFCTELMIVAPIGLSITKKAWAGEVAADLLKAQRPPVIWLHFQDCTGCTETLLRTSRPGRRRPHPQHHRPRISRDPDARLRQAGRRALQSAMTKYAGQVCAGVRRLDSDQGSRHLLQARRQARNRASGRCRLPRPAPSSPSARALRGADCLQPATIPPARTAFPI